MCLQTILSATRLWHLSQEPLGAATVQINTSSVLHLAGCLEETGVFIFKQAALLARFRIDAEEHIFPLQFFAQEVNRNDFSIGRKKKKANNFHLFLSLLK